MMACVFVNSNLFWKNEDTLIHRSKGVHPLIQTKSMLIFKKMYLTDH